ncbi:MAG: GNAT family N-acetyltransferase [Ilumatobacteraceae bacterium]
MGEWVCDITGGGYHAERSNAIGLRKGDELVCGVVYENWNGRSIVCHIAFLDRLTPAYIAAIFDYPFNVCGVDKIIAPVGSKNAKALSLVRKMGFTEEARIKDADTDGDVVFLTMTRDACRFLGHRYGQKITSTAAST